MDKLYDLEIDLSSNDGGLSRAAFKDGMRVRLFGHTQVRKVQIPQIVGAVFFINDGGDDVSVRHGAAIPITVDRGAIAHVMFDGSPNWMRKVGF